MLEGVWRVRRNFDVAVVFSNGPGCFHCNGKRRVKVSEGGFGLISADIRALVGSNRCDFRESLLDSKNVKFGSFRLG